MKQFEEFLFETEVDHRVQLRGHCQACGREQAYRTNGLIAKHGYEIKERGMGGWFEGTCPGAHHPTLEVDRKFADQIIVDITHQVAETEAKLVKAEDGKLRPSQINTSLNHRKPTWIPFDQGDLRQQNEAMRRFIYQLESRIRLGKQTIKDITHNIQTFHGTAHRNVKILKGPDPNKTISVGDKVKVLGKVVTVTKIETARVFGVGPSMNGTYAEHVYWDDNGRTRGYPKRFAKRVIE